MNKERIQSLSRLKELSDERKSVIVPNDRTWNKPKPAAFVIHLSGVQLLLLFDYGMFVYEKEGK